MNWIVGNLQNALDTWNGKLSEIYSLVTQSPADFKGGAIWDIITNINGDKVLFLKPQTYMNLSGDSVRKVVDYYNIDIDDILVISDDLDLNVGNYKLKMYGSCGGHNGLRDIENKLGTNHFKRLKIGISNDKDIDTKDYVTSNMSKHDKDIIDNLYKELCHVLDDYFVLDFGDLMSKYNRKNK